MAHWCTTSLSFFSKVQALPLRLDVRITPDVVLSKDAKLFLEPSVLIPKRPDLVGLLYDVIITAVDYDKLTFARPSSSAACVAWLGPIALIAV